MKRYVSTSFWDDEWVQTLNLVEKGVYLYLLTNPLTNIAGVYKLSPRRIVFDTGLEENEMEKIMDKFEKAGKAYRHGEFVIIPSWPSHQAINTNVDKGIRRILKTLSYEVISFLVEVGYRYPLDEFLKGSSHTAAAVQEAEPVPDVSSEEMRKFLRLWQTTKDKDGHSIFQITATIENPRDWERYWRESPPSTEEIETAFRNFADGINSGAIQRRFIPATPDRFVLKGGITRYQQPLLQERGKGGEHGSGDMLSGKIEL